MTINKINFFLISFLFILSSCAPPSQVNIIPSYNYSLEKGVYIECQSIDDLNVTNLLEYKFNSAGIPTVTSKYSNHTYTFSFLYRWRLDVPAGRVFSEFKGVLKDDNNIAVANFSFTQSDFGGKTIDSVLNEIVNKILSRNLKLDKKTDEIAEQSKLEKWLKFKITEPEVRKDLDNRINNVNAIEGIWNVSEKGKAKSISDGSELLNIPENNNVYRIAIIQDTTNSGYDFICLVLESKYDEWTTGMLKARFRKTAYDKLYEGIWYRKDFSEERDNYVIDEFGIMTHNSSRIESLIGKSIELYTETTFIKAYPLLNQNSFSPASVTKNIKSTGSGFILSSDGIVITNYHVIKEAKNIEILFPSIDIKLDAFLKLKDKNNDIAILQIFDFDLSKITKTDIPYSIGKINSVKTGQEVFTLGFPLGSIMGTKPRLSSGRINSLYGIEEDPRLFQIGNPLQPGNSGGPLFNENGELVGIVVSGLNAEYFYENMGIIPQNVNFAVKVSYLESLIGMLPNEKEISKRNNTLSGKIMEEQIELLNPFIVQVHSY